MNHKIVLKGAYKEIEKHVKELNRDLKDLRRIESEISESESKEEKPEDYIITARKTVINDITDQIKILNQLTEEIPYFLHSF